MGWGKFLADLGKDYLSERGIDGAMEDAGKLKDGVQKLFGSDSSNDEEMSAYQQEWNDTVDEIDNRLNDEDYQGAVNVLESFYSNHNEDYDFWYIYWRTFIASRQWFDKAMDDAMDENTVKYSSETEILYSNVRRWLSRTKDNASEDEEHEKYQELSSELMSDKNEIDGFLKDNKVWLEINSMINLQATRSGKQLSNFNTAINKVKSLYHYDKSNYSYNYGLFRVYSQLLDSAKVNATLLDEIRPQFQQIQNEIRQVTNDLKRTTGDDQETINSTAQYINDITELLGQVRECLSNPAAQQPRAVSNSNANTSSSSNSANEQEYLEEIKACLDDDGEISARERRILNRLRESLGISEARAQELEASLSQGLTDDEKEYVEALKDSLVDGTISNRERRLLDKLRASLGISEARAAELEKHLS